MLSRISSLLCLIAAFACVASADLLSIDPVSSSAAVGQTVTLEIRIAGVQDLFAYQFDVLFDPQVLQVSQDIQEGSFLSSAGATFFIPGIADNVLGSITFTANTLIAAVSGASGGGVLATVVFDAIGAGSSGVSLDNAVLLDSNLGDIADGSPSATVRVTSGTAPIPEPATVALLASCIAAASLVRRRTKRDPRNSSAAAR